MPSSCTTILVLLVAGAHGLSKTFQQAGSKSQHNVEEVALALQDAVPVADTTTVFLAQASTGCKDSKMCGVGMDASSAPVYKRQGPAAAVASKWKGFIGGLATQLLSLSSSTETRAKEPTAEEIEMYSNIALTVIQITVAVAFMFMYKSKVVDRIPRLQRIEPVSRGKDFKVGLCGCCGDFQTCLHAMCCGPCRAGHSWQVSNVTDYMIGVIGQILCGMIGCWCLVGCANRQDLRAKLGLEPDGCCDILTWIFCAPCAIGQEAMEVDELSGVKVSCCCNVVEVDGQGQGLLQAEVVQGEVVQGEVVPDAPAAADAAPEPTP